MLCRYRTSHSGRVEAGTPRNKIQENAFLGDRTSIAPTPPVGPAGLSTEEFSLHSRGQYPGAGHCIVQPRLVPDIAQCSLGQYRTSHSGSVPDIAQRVRRQMPIFSPFRTTVDSRCRSDARYRDRRNVLISPGSTAPVSEREFIASQAHRTIRIAHS
eukprot:3391174-Rhodomonas_salina.2